ncbi:aminodeoxychorismate lyase [Shewanella fidelis]|uniref:Aminodeoxychorismate lyase n=1 Tax=Shewanella fidelis TaxID=173509 RepID=A0AAW8NMQ8_9GAMM|nr:aminodeoxychorismate lyase [Shewanella fidelis]MDR8523655.1 aminodeoxychorismate lyase [Shewanella fidelis]MDW4810202.1 aminodeoxychorismate lyase [Shewanella fidelis]MDW4814347.1 aminodeoxychorismate lyase [Shewanella fidelis]MDW4818438.1 aminodeoxychorismate lyase [Shewanella fidelis]MDW4823910.1 aminodeoxychorismate lyase [Shewanella fidelis]
MSQVWVNGQPDVNVNPLDRGLTYGDGLFATMRVSQGKILFLAAHLDRLTQGAFRLGINWLPSNALKLQLSSLAQANPNACIKLLITRGAGGRGYGVDFSRDNLALSPQKHVSSVSCEASSHLPKVCEIVSVSAVPAQYAIWQQQGICLALSDIKLGKQAKLAGIKHCNRLEQVLIKSASLPKGAQDWLVLDCDDNIVESSMANLFFVIDKTIMTPRISFAGVAGMMREQVIYQLLNLGYKVEVSDLHYDMLNKAQHVFLTNSLFGLIDVLAIGNRQFSRTPLTSTVREQLSLTL